MGIDSAYNIGLKGIYAQMLALQITGHNIANANTEGQSKQRAVMVPSMPMDNYPGQIGTGVDVSIVERIRDQLLDEKFRVDNSDAGRLEQLERIYHLVEIPFNEAPLSNDDVTQSGLQGMMRQLWDDWQKLAATPDDESVRQVLKEHAVMLSESINYINTQLEKIEQSLDLEIERKVDEVNKITADIANLNKEINFAYAAQTNPNDLLDRRDQRLNELSKIIDINVIIDERKYMNVTAGGNLIVGNANSYDLTLNKNNRGFNEVSYTVSGVAFSPRNGELKGLTDGRDEVIPYFRSMLDDFARGVIFEVNKIHSTGLGGTAGVSSLTSSNAVLDEDAPLDEAFLPFDVKTGSFWVTIYDAGSEVVEQLEVPVTAGTTTLEDIRAAIDGMTYASSSITDGLIRIDAASGYTFGFNTSINAVNPTTSPYSPGWTGASTSGPLMDGAYLGDSDDTWTFTAASGGVVGTDNITIEVRDGSSNLIRTFTLDSSYQAGDLILVSEGVSFSLGAGTVAAADTFQVDLIADSDTSDALAALGLNAFFTGKNADTMAVAQRLQSDVSLIAASPKPAPGGTEVAFEIASIQNKAVSFSGSAALEFPVWKGDSLSMPRVSLGTYTGESADRWKVTVGGAGGSVGTDTITFNVTDSSFNTVASITIDNTYQGEAIEISDGVYMRFSTTAGQNSAEAGDYFYIDVNPSAEKTPNGFYMNAIANLGISAEHARKEKENKDAILEYLQNSRNSISQISIDEEMVNMVRFQSAYQANAKFIAMLQKIVDITFTILQ